MKLETLAAKCEKIQSATPNSSGGGEKAKLPASKSTSSSGSNSSSNSNEKKLKKEEEEVAVAVQACGSGEQPQPNEDSLESLYENHFTALASKQAATGNLPYLFKRHVFNLQ